MMSVQVIHDSESRTSALYCNTSDVVFGPVMYGSDREDVVAFIQSLPYDPRLLSDDSLHAAWSKWQEVSCEL